MTFIWLRLTSNQDLVSWQTRLAVIYLYASFAGPPFDSAAFLRCATSWNTSTYLAGTGELPNLEGRRDYETRKIQRPPVDRRSSLARYSHRGGDLRHASNSAQTRANFASEYESSRK